MTALIIDKIVEYDDATVIGVSPLFYTQESFTRSNGSIAARIYERLTKASRRREPNKREGWFYPTEQAYRRGVKDTLEALRIELS